MLPYNFFERVIYEIDLKNTFPDDFSPPIVLYEPELSGSFYFTMLHPSNQSLTVNKIDLLIDDNKSCKFNCDGYKYLLICAANDSKIINVDLLKLIGSINLGFIRYSSESYIGTCSMNIKPTYITLHGFYNKGYSYSTYQVYGIK